MTTTYQFDATPKQRTGRQVTINPTWFDWTILPTDHSPQQAAHYAAKQIKKHNLPKGVSVIAATSMLVDFCTKLRASHGLLAITLLRHGDGLRPAAARISLKPNHENLQPGLPSRDTGQYLCKTDKLGYLKYEHTTNNQGLWTHVHHTLTRKTILAIDMYTPDIAVAEQSRQRIMNLVNSINPKTSKAAINRENLILIGEA